MREGLLVLGFLLLATAAFLLARHWQTAGQVYQRLAVEPLCDLTAGPCRQAVGDGWVSLRIQPAPIPLMRPIGLTLETGDLALDQAWIEIRGLNMDMGLNRTRLSPAAPGRWSGETILPVCSQRRMDWEATLRLDLGAHRLEVPFLFHTVRR